MLFCMLTNERENCKLPNKICVFIWGFMDCNPGDTDSIKTESMLWRDKGVQSFLKKKEDLHSRFEQNVICARIAIVTLISM